MNNLRINLSKMLPSMDTTCCGARFRYGREQCRAGLIALDRKEDDAQLPDASDDRTGGPRCAHRREVFRKAVAL